MLDDSAFAARAYLQHLTEEDLRLLGVLAREGSGTSLDARAMRERPESALDLIARTSARQLLFPESDRAEPLLPASPFLMFAVAVHEVTTELEHATYVTEWLGPQHRTPVFDVSALRDFLSAPLRRLFLVELLASYTHVASGSVVVATRRGLRRRRFSELDPLRLAEMLEVVSEPERPGILRRLGDLALFLTGVFPDHTATRGLTGGERARLLRSGAMRQLAGPLNPPIPGFGDAAAVDLYEQLGRRWYRLAYQSLPRPIPVDLRVVGELPERFGEARRILNVLTDRHLFSFRQQWFGSHG